MDAPQLNPEQTRAVELMLSGANVFLTGEAGCGKTTTLQAYFQLSKRKVLFVAPTGSAASRLGGMTMQRAFGLIRRAYLPNYQPALTPDKRDALVAIETLIIDEVSMVRSDMLHAVDVTLQAVHGNLQPFGGIQVILVGDLFQLLPIAKYFEKAIVQENFGGILPFYALGWRYGGFKNVVLKQVHRQSDQNFVSMLNEVRVGGRDADADEVGSLSTVDRLNAQLQISYLISPKAVVLCSTNALALAINQSRDYRLGSDPTEYLADYYGRVDTDDIPALMILHLRLGSRVLLIANKVNPDGETFAYTNGDQGTVLEFQDNTITVRLDRGATVQVGRHRWESTDLIYDKENKTLTESVIGFCTQFPLRLGYALTAHKSQGMSLDTVYLNLGSPLFAEGMLYVALSRCRSLQGLTLSRPILPRELMVNPEVAAFYESLQERQEICPESGLQ